jgi:uncharacterized sodium:solute symporter family permease YidK
VSAPGESSDAEMSETALAALFLSIVWLFGLGSVAGIVLGRRSLRAIAASEGKLAGRSLAIGAIAVGIFGLLSLGLVFGMAVDAG